ncbi:MAG: hypothetical protein UY63_C0004G0036 [Parcubacteria group bacterium GW2011_GWA2_51_10]|nr:MAG: hypothetical protein UY63_C0004G0036 [Parcubacteria group bacterium GW2011_GWA2_51_10]
MPDFEIKDILLNLEEDPHMFYAKSTNPVVQAFFDAQSRGDFVSALKGTFTETIPKDTINKARAIIGLGGSLVPHAPSDLTPEALADLWT